MAVVSLGEKPESNMSQDVALETARRSVSGRVGDDVNDDVYLLNAVDSDWYSSLEEALFGRR